MAMPRTADNGFDAAVVDRENHTVALVEVKAHPVERWATILPRQLARFAERVAFVLTIDPNCIQLYRSGGESLGEPIVRLDTRQVLQHYDPDFPRERVFESYLLTLVEAWLRDLAYHWMSEDPPGSEELGRAGLLEMLERGTTQRFGA
jgi:hypothetical protein